ncbi:MAG: thioredoxin family protein [Planctomycetes bacterium]|nr:thioredoxin family protein [Planctomycetota bacterium]
MLRSRCFATVALAVFLTASSAMRLTADDKPADRRAKVGDDPNISSQWIYDDIPTAIAQAKRDNKPLLVVFR